MAVRVLIVDDEPLIVKGLRFSLEQEGYEVEDAADGETALAMIQTRHYNLILLDVMLPGLSGMEVLLGVREQSSVPVIMLTAKGDDMDKILGLEYGADDYMVKPFNILEVKARIRTILRRSTIADPYKTLQLHDIVLQLSSRSVMRGDTDIVLSVREFDLLHAMMENPGKVFEREELMDILNVRDRSTEGIYRHDLRTVDVYMRRLREKLERNAAIPQYIMTRWGIGYYFAPQK